MLRPEKTPYGKWMRCPQGHSQKEIVQESETLISSSKNPGLRIGVSDGKNPLAVHDHVCKRCGHPQAEIIEIAPSYSDEDATIRMKCGKCGFVEQLEGKVK